jgi:hypothetical protein
MVVAHVDLSWFSEGGTIPTHHDQLPPARVARRDQGHIDLTDIRRGGFSRGLGCLRQFRQSARL